MARKGEYIPIDLDDNNRHAIEARRKRFPGREFPALGWGVCRHGYGLQNLPPLTETQARRLAASLNRDGEVDAADVEVCPDCDGRGTFCRTCNETGAVAV